MYNKLKKYNQLKYSSLLNIIFKNQVLRIKGPLGVNYVRIPSPIKIIIDPLEKKLLIGLRTNVFLKKKLPFIRSTSAIISTSCRTAVLGDLLFIGLEGLGLKFVSKSLFSFPFLSLSISLGLSEPLLYFLHKLRARFFIKAPRQLLLYSTDYSFIQNNSRSILNLRVPDKYKQKGFFVTRFI